VLAANDPTVSAPRIKIGHTDKRFEADESLDGQPAMGTVRNMTLSDDGQTVIGDLTDVPAWLADSMQSAYPGRSIEGGFGFKAPSGHEYKLVISNLALLGETWPGVGSLPDLREVLERNGSVPEPVAAETGFALNGGHVERFVQAKIGLDAEDEAEVQKLIAKGMSRPAAEKQVKESADEKNEKVKASLDVGGLPRIFAADLRAGKVPKAGDTDQARWWPRSVQAEDDGKLSILIDTDAGQLLTLPIQLAADQVTYGTPVAVAASTGALSTEDFKGPRVLASWPSNQAPRPDQKGKTMKIKADIDQAKLAKALGLAEDADEAAIEKALSPEASTTSEQTSTATTPTDGGASTSTAKLPEGVVAIDQAKLAELEAGAQAGATVAASLAKSERDTTITAAIKGGRIVAKQRPEWEKRWDLNRDETRKLLTASVADGGLAAVIPVDQIEAGISGDGENVLASPAAAGRLFPELATEVAA
jgi:hypothetical protein